MVTKIKVFRFTSLKKYEEEINEFIKDKIFIDLKIRDFPDRNLTEAVVIYRERTFHDDARDNGYELLSNNNFKEVKKSDY